MTFDQLEMLEAVVIHGNYKAAAEHLHKSQPSLSVGIKKLEEEFGVVLFDPLAYRSQLTDQGKIFYQWARQCLESFRNLSVVGQEMGRSRLEPKINIVVDPLVDFDSLKVIFETCVAPKLATELHLQTAILGRGMERVLAGEAHFAIGVVAKSHPDIESYTFSQIEMIPVAVKKVASQYQNYPQVIVSSPDSSGELTKGPKCFVSDHHMKSKLILSGYGWGRLSKFEIEGEFKNRKLVKIKDSKVRPISFDLHVMRNITKAMGPLGKKIWEDLRAEA